jgi:hypothetical protein
VSGAFEKPDDEHRIEQTHEGSDTAYGSLLSGRRIDKAEQLLSFSEKDLNSPPTSVRLEQVNNVYAAVGAEEDPERHLSLVGRDDEFAGNPRHDERLGHGMGTMGQDPPTRDHEHVRERRAGERDMKDLQNAHQAGKIRIEHGRFVVVR